MHSSIYQPAEDSYLLLESVEKYLKKQENKKIKILDIGSGSGIQALICKKLGFDNVLTADINPNAVKYLKKQGLKSIQSNIFSNKQFKDKRFDLIIFNPPYLPEDKKEPKDSRLQTTAGKKGYEIIIRFLKQAKSYLNKQGAILFLFSSLSQPKIILKNAEQLGYNFRLLNKQSFFFEILFVYEIRYR